MNARCARLLPFFVLALVALAGSPAAADEVFTSAEGFSLTISTERPATAGQATEVLVVLTPRMGFKVNQEFPISLRVKAPEDVDVPDASLDKSDATVSSTRAEFRVAMTPRATGDKNLTFSLRFAVCTEKTCEPRKETVDFKLRVR